MKINVEFLLTHDSSVYDVGRIPCIGECVDIDDSCHEVKMVIHLLNADPEKQYQAIIRVK